MVQITDDLIRRTILKNLVGTSIITLVVLVIGIGLIIWYKKSSNIKKVVLLAGIIFIIGGSCFVIKMLLSLSSINNYSVKHMIIVDKEYSCRGSESSEYYYLYLSDGQDEKRVQSSFHNYHFVRDIGEGAYVVTSNSTDMVLCVFYQDNTSSHIDGESIYCVDKDEDTGYTKVTNIKHYYYKHNEPEGYYYKN